MHAAHQQLQRTRTRIDPYIYIYIYIYTATLLHVSTQHTVDSSDIRSMFN